MTTRIDTRFAQLNKEGRSAFVTFVMAGDPDPETSLAIVKALPQAGADVIELGMPFTDPMADGPSIQAAGLRALKAGMTLKKTLAMVKRFRETDDADEADRRNYYKVERWDSSEQHVFEFPANQSLFNKFGSRATTPILAAAIPRMNRASLTSP